MEKCLDAKNLMPDKSWFFFKSVCRCNNINNSLELLYLSIDRYRKKIPQQILVCISDEI